MGDDQPHRLGSLAEGSGGQRRRARRFAPKLKRAKDDKQPHDDDTAHTTTQEDNEPSKSEANSQNAPVALPKTPLDGPREAIQHAENEKTAKRSQTRQHGQETARLKNEKHVNHQHLDLFEAEQAEESGQTSQPIRLPLSVEDTVDPADALGKEKEGFTILQLPQGLINSGEEAKLTLQSNGGASLQAGGSFELCVNGKKAHHEQIACIGDELIVVGDVGEHVVAILDEADADAG